MSTSKTGKHGHAKVHLVAIDIFTNKKLEDLSPSTHNMDVPNVTRTEYQLVNIDDGFLNLMTNEGVSKDDVKLPEGELGDQIQQMFDDGKDLLVTIVAAMGEEHALGVKEAPTGVSAGRGAVVVAAVVSAALRRPRPSADLCGFLSRSCPLVHAIFLLCLQRLYRPSKGETACISFS